MRKLRVLKLESFTLLNGIVEPLQKLLHLEVFHLSHCIGLNVGLDLIRGLKLPEELSLSFALSIHYDLRLVLILISLRVLRMASCNLNIIVEPISNLPNIEVLHIPNNPCLQRNPKQLMQLLKLEDIELSRNTSIKCQYDDRANLTGVKYLNMIDVDSVTYSLTFSQSSLHWRNCACNQCR